MGIYETAIFKTLSYASLFDYPLTKGELWRYLIWESKKKPNLFLFSKQLNSLLNQKKIFQIKRDYLLKKNYSWTVKREKAEIEARYKISVAQKITKILSVIPTIELIGLSGRLALGTAKKEDDIDLFVVTSPKTLWLTRALILIILFLLGVKKGPEQRIVSNKICLNMLVDRNHLKLPKKEQDLFSAHEVAQMTTIFERNNCYKDFLNQNMWIRKYLPNCVFLRNSPSRSPFRHRGFWIENLAQKFQLWYMRKRRTTEIIKKGYLRFHPEDARKWILPEYNRLIKTIDQENNKTKDQ